MPFRQHSTFFKTREMLSMTFLFFVLSVFQLGNGAPTEIGNRIQALEKIQNASHSFIDAIFEFLGSPAKIEDESVEGRIGLQDFIDEHKHFNVGQKRTIEDKSTWQKILDRIEDYTSKFKTNGGFDDFESRAGFQEADQKSYFDLSNSLLQIELELSETPIRNLEYNEYLYGSVEEIEKKLGLKLSKELKEKLMKARELYKSYQDAEWENLKGEEASERILLNGDPTQRYDVKRFLQELMTKAELDKAYKDLEEVKHLDRDFLGSAQPQEIEAQLGHAIKPKTRKALTRYQNILKSLKNKTYYKIDDQFLPEGSFLPTPIVPIPRFIGTKDHRRNFKPTTIDQEAENFYKSLQGLKTVDPTFLATVPLDKIKTVLHSLGTPTIQAIERYQRMYQSILKNNKLSPEDLQVAAAAYKMHLDIIKPTEVHEIGKFFQDLSELLHLDLEVVLKLSQSEIEEILGHPLKHQTSEALARLHKIYKVSTQQIPEKSLSYEDQILARDLEAFEYSIFIPKEDLTTSGPDDQYFDHESEKEEPQERLLAPIEYLKN